MLEEKGIPSAGVMHRVKHTAGVWTKMHGKELRLDEVYDLFAFHVNGFVWNLLTSPGGIARVLRPTSTVAPMA